MVDHAAKSFEIRTTRQYLDELLRPAYADFLADRLSSRKAIACAIFAWHLRDWVWAQNKDGLQNVLSVKNISDFDLYLFTDCPKLSIIQEIATGAKHFKDRGSDVQSTELAHGFASELSLVFTQSHLIVKTETLYFAEHLLNKAVVYWESRLPPSWARTLSPTSVLLVAYLVGSTRRACQT